VNITVTFELFQLFAFEVGESDDAIVGGTAVWMFRVTLAGLELLPALSVAVPLMI